MKFQPPEPRHSDTIGAIGLILFSLLFFCPVTGKSAETPDIRQSLVRITNTIQNPDYRAPWNPGSLSKVSGTGFIIDGSRIMTNAHVVSNTRFLTVEREGDPKLYPARVAFVAHDCDLAILSVDTPDFLKNLLPLEFDKIPQLETTVSVYGYPIGGDRMSVTRGVVSRVDFQTYSHSSADSHLIVQIDAAINPGNSGGPVLQNGKVVGVAFQGYSGDVAQNVGYIIPVPVIHRFLKDIQDGHYDRYVDLAINYFPLVNPGERKILGLKDDDRGVLVSSVLKQGSADGVLQAGDVLLTIDGLPIGSDGFVSLEGTRVEMVEIVERKFTGDTVKFLALRNGRQLELSVRLKPFWPYLMASFQYDIRPRYVVFAGLVFQPLTRNLMQSLSANTLRLRYLYEQYVNESIYMDRSEIIVLSDVLADPVNTYFGAARLSVVSKVNGKAIRRLEDLAESFSKPAEYYVIELEGESRPIVVEASAVEPARERIRKFYNIHEEQYLGDAITP
ncbi:MAG: trypsin-like peptidase domain-containing protein [Methylacidiphilales bacterium]|nr:trypsin-like peptidase domain-containing protein [Candidatus Methylacidiphilales bacterium]